MRRKKPRHLVTTGFSPEEYEGITLLAERQVRSLTEVVREAVRLHLAGSTGFQMELAWLNVARRKTMEEREPQIAEA